MEPFRSKLGCAVGFVMLLSSLFHVITPQKIIKVDPINGKDSDNCIRGKGSACQSLDFVFQNGTRDVNNTEILLSNGSHILNSQNDFKYVLNFSLLSSSFAVINCTIQNAGISFVFSDSILISHVKIQNCGVRHKSTTVDYNNKTQLYHPFVKIAVYFAYSKNVNISHSHFAHNQGIGVGFYDVNGNIQIAESRFISNSDEKTFKKTESERFISGGGIYIEFTYCGALDPFNCTSRIHQEEYNHDSNYVITGCLFHNNSAENEYRRSFFPEMSWNNTYVSFGKGAGLSISNLGNSTKNKFTISHCDFANNKALWGAALYVTFKDTSDANSVKFWRNTFTSNNATYAGGGVRLESIYFDINKKHLPLGNNISFEESDFERNIAIWGGGLSIEGTTHFTEDSHRDVLISNCTFTENKATVGFALGMVTQNINHDVIGRGLSSRANVTNSNFQRNTLAYTEDQKVIGQGSIYLEEVSLVLVGNNTFLHNNYTAIVLDTALLILKNYGITQFKENFGVEGGALALYGKSWIMLEEYCNAVFVRNRAKRRGGAIYVKTAGPPRVAFQTTELQTSRCFLRYQNSLMAYNDWQVNLTFKQNIAPEASGKSIYASTIQFCRGPGESRSNSKALNWTFIHYESSQNNQLEVVTNAIEIDVNTSDWNAIPYLPFSPNIVMYDEKNQSVYGSLEISIAGLNNDSVKLDPPNNLFLIRNNISGLRLTGKINSSFSVEFSTMSGQMVISPQYNASLKKCLPGFKPDDQNKKCVCMDSTNSDVVRCEENGTVFILKGEWGFVNNKTDLLQTVICPVHYCKCNHAYEGYLCQFEKDDQCAKNRKGTLCSECEKGLSVRLGNEECTICSNMWLLMLIPLFLVLSFFVMVILYFNIDAFSGYLNAYLYSYQMVILLIPKDVHLDPFISFIVGITALQGTGGNFGMCLYNGMNNLEKVAFNYVAPSYMIFSTVIMGMVIPGGVWNKLFFRKSAQSEIESEVRRRSFGRALSFVLVICYSSFTGVTLKLLHWININGKTVLFLAANVGFFEGAHIYYGILAILVLICVVLFFPILLLFTPFFTYRFSIIQRIEPVLNALKNCFRDRNAYRMFAAFYFISRLCLLVISVFIQEEVTRLIVLSIACVVLQAVFSLFQPYKFWTYNVWDILLLTNMCVISLLSLILSVPFTIPSRVRDNSIVGLKVLVYLPFITIVIRLASYCYHKWGYSDAPDPSGGISARGRFLIWKSRVRKTGQPLINIPERVNEDFESGYEAYM